MSGPLRVNSTYHAGRREGAQAIIDEASSGIDWGVLVNVLQHGIEVDVVNLDNKTAASLLRVVAARLDAADGDIKEWE